MIACRLTSFRLLILTFVLAALGLPITRTLAANELPGGPTGGVEYFLMHQLDVFAGQESVGASLRLTADPVGETAVVEITDKRGDVVGKQDLGKVTQRIWRSSLKTAVLQPGEYRAVCTVLDASGKEVGKDSAALNVTPRPERKAFEAPIRIAYAARRTANTFPVLVGVPFARGVASVEDLRTHLQLLDEKGNPVAIQTRDIGWWSAAKDSVQWAHVEFLATVPPTGDFGNRAAPDNMEGTLNYTLRFTPEETPSVEVKNPVQVTEVDTVTLDNGLLRVTLDPRKQNPFAGIALLKDGNAEPLLNDAAEASAGFFLTDEKKLAYAPAKVEPWRVTVEKSGPIAATVRLDADLVNDAGHQIGSLIVRVKQAAGLPRFTVSHTFVYSDVSETVQITSMGLKLPFKSVTDLQVGTDEFYRGEPVRLDGEPVLMLQSDYRRFTIERGPENARKLVKFADMAPGWLDLNTGNARAVVSFPEGLFWKEFPKEFYVEPSGMTWIGLVPAHADKPMDLRTQIAGSADNWKATGFAKTHEFTFDFYQGEQRTPIQNLELAYGVPVALAGPDYIRSTDAFEGLPPIATGDRKAREWAATMRKYAWYGVLEYGDAPYSGHGNNWYMSKTGMPDFDAGRYHLHHDQIQARWLGNHWLAILAGGNRRMLDMAFAITRHHTDVQTLHVAPKEQHYSFLNVNNPESHLGGYHNHGGSQQHWSGKTLPINAEATPKLLPMLLCWNLTGWERAWDTVETWKRGLMAEPDISDEQYTSRRCMGAVEGASRLYRQTWDPALLESARQHWNAAFDFHQGKKVSQIEPAGFWNNLEHIAIGCDAYWPITHDQRVGHVAVQTPPYGRRTTTIGDLLAYRIDGDPQQLRHSLPSKLAETVAAAPRNVMALAPDAPPPTPGAAEKAETAPMAWMQGNHLSWVEPEDDLFGAHARQLARQLWKDGKIENNPSADRVKVQSRFDPKRGKNPNAITFIVRKEAGKEFVFDPVHYFRNTVDHRFKVWDSTGKLIDSGEVPGLQYTQSSHENGRYALKADLPAGVYRVRFSYNQGPQDPEHELAKYGLYTEVSVGLSSAPGSAWMIEMKPTGGYLAPRALWTDGPYEQWARFVVPKGTDRLEIMLTGDERFGQWVALNDPAGNTAAVVENTEVNRRMVEGIGRGLFVTPAAGVTVTPGVWEVGLVPRVGVRFEVVKGALPYITLNPKALLSEQELTSLPEKWERDEVE